MKRVVIAGGGYAGTKLARALDRSFDVVLVEPREAFVHNVAVMRALVQPALLEQIILPYDRLLNRGRVVRARATAVTEGAVSLSSGETLEADYVVLATGSGYGQPFKPATDAMADFRAAVIAANAAIDAAHEIAIAGAGAVGVELAGEIAARYSSKSVTLIAAGHQLLADFAPQLGDRLAAALKALGVRIKFAAKAEMAVTDRPHAGPVRLASGEVLAADLVIPAVGARPDTRMVSSLATARYDRIGRVLTDGWMRPAGLSNVFALGDMAANGDLMTIVAASRQVPWLARTLHAVAAGAAIGALPHYRPWPAPPILVALGPRRGASLLPITAKGWMAGAWVTRIIKGKSLFIPRYRQDFGL